MENYTMSHPVSTHDVEDSCHEDDDGASPVVDPYPSEQEAIDEELRGHAVAPLPTLQWGLPALVPDTAVAAWGGRGISSPTGSRWLDLPHDRQHAVGDPEAVAHIIDAINGPGMDAYRAARRDGKLQDDVAGLVTLDTCCDSVKLQADTRGSCGYVYLTAWIEGAS